VPGSFIADPRQYKENTHAREWFPQPEPGLWSAMSFDPDAVRAFEYAGWEKAASAYHCDGWYLLPMAAMLGCGLKPQ
jgi:hypothetical protein